MNGNDNIEDWYELNVGENQPVVIYNLDDLKSLCENMEITKVNIKFVDIKDDDNDIPNSPQFALLASNNIEDQLFTESNLFIGHLSENRNSVTLGGEKDERCLALYSHFKEMIYSYSPYPQIRGMEVQREHNGYVDVEREMRRRLSVLQESWTPVNRENLNPFYTPYILCRNNNMGHVQYYLCLFVDKDQEGQNTRYRMTFLYKIENGVVTNKMLCNQMYTFNGTNVKIFEAPKEFGLPYMQFLGIDSPTAKIAMSMKQVGVNLDTDTMDQLTDYLEERKKGGRRRRKGQTKKKAKRRRTSRRRF